MISFFTHSQHFTFIESGHSVSPTALLAGHTYTVQVTIQNDQFNTIDNVVVHLSHGPIGIGYPGGDLGIVQSPPVSVPPAEDNVTPGLAVVSFHFTAPAGGHGCLCAALQPSAAYTTGPAISNNFSVQGAYVGQNNRYSFYVFGDASAAEAMQLIISETIVSGPAGSWSPLLLIPNAAGVFGAPQHSGVIVPLGAGVLYLMGLQVTPPPGAAGEHRFIVTGIVSGVNKGSVAFDVKIEAAALPAPQPYITGSYQSPDIILLDRFHRPVPLGGGGSDTLLQANAEYTMQAIIRNSSPTPAPNTMVRFWNLPGGIALDGPLLDVQTVTVPHGSITLTSSKKFRTGPLGTHACAAVSLANLAAGVGPDATMPQYIPDPASNPGHSASAWRNTDAVYLWALAPIEIPLEAAWPPGHPPGPDPMHLIHVDVTTERVPADFAQQPAVRAVDALLREAGAASSLPLYLATQLRATLPKVNLGTRVELAKSAPKDVVLADAPPKLPAAATGAALKVPSKVTRVPIKVTGTIPATAKIGEVYLVTVTAHYPAFTDVPARSVEFVLHAHIIEKPKP